MKTLFTLILAVAGMLASFASNAYWITKLDVTTDSGPDVATEFVFTWDTPTISGAVDSSALTDMTMRVFNGANLVYTDVMIVAGVTQDIAGNGRVAADILWDFNLDTMTLSDFDNDIAQAQGNVSGFIGTSFNVYSDLASGFVSAERHEDNIFAGFTDYTVNAQSTAVPIPSTVLLMLIAPLLLARRTYG